MPSLNFKGKSEIYAHHLTVPFCDLKVDAQKSFAIQSQNGKKTKPSLEDNLIIHGDNLLALKALLPKYAGKVKCVYIDPPYNTGNESWVFNDNVNSPLMQEWLAKEVGIDDMERHDKWLCMMWPRLHLLKDLLSPDGVLICAIDHNEREHLGIILSEIFPDRQITCVTVVHNPRGIQGSNFSYTHEYAFFVYPNIKSVIGSRKIERKDTQWRDLRDHGGEALRTDAKNCFYPIFIQNDEIIGFGDVLPEDQHPKKRVLPKKNGFEVWPIDKDGIERKWRYARQSVESVKHLLRVTTRKEIQIGKDFGSYRTVWTGSRYDSNEYGTKLLKSLIKNCPFNFPKSFYNVSDCLRAVVGQDKEAIVLDSFAGSGTTAHAVLDLNKEDGGNRKFILVECEGYAHTITAERVRQVIKGLPKSKDKNLQKGLAGSFTYSTLGEEISEHNLLKGKDLPNYDVLSKYIFYTATGHSLSKIKKNKDFYIAKADQNTAFFVIYKSDLNFLKSDDSALHLERKRAVQEVMKKEKCHRAIVFASACFCDPEDLPKEGITFCQIPFEIHRLKI